MACACGLAAAGLLFAVLTVGLPGQRGIQQGTGALSGRVIFGESSSPTFGELAPGESVVRAISQKDVVETVDLGRRNAYSFQLWPGSYKFRVGAEFPAGNDDFCTQKIRVKARQEQHMILRCTPREEA